MQRLPAGIPEGDQGHAADVLRQNMVCRPWMPRTASTHASPDGPLPDRSISAASMANNLAPPSANSSGPAYSFDEFAKIGSFVRPEVLSDRGRSSRRAIILHAAANTIVTDIVVAAAAPVVHVCDPPAVAMVNPTHAPAAAPAVTSPPHGTVALRPPPDGNTRTGPIDTRISAMQAPAVRADASSSHVEGPIHRSSITAHDTSGTLDHRWAKEGERPGAHAFAPRLRQSPGEPAGTVACGTI
jgi:hypothetical protein